jgi:hypothetical protein
MAKARPQAPTSSETTDAADEWDRLATALNHWGILHIAPRRPRRAGVPETARELFARLAGSDEPRIHQAIVLLLLTHPQLADDAQAAISQLAGNRRDRAMRRYVAATALQRMARTRIAQHLGSSPLLPVTYLDELDLPPLDEEFGRVTLLALAAGEQERYGYDSWGTYLGLLDLFLHEIRRRDWGRTCDSEPTKRA